jgi:Flp pilus assembly protein TadB
MAAIGRGMDIPPLPIELIDGRSPRPRSRKSSLRSGLIWFFVGLAIVIGLVSSNEHHIPMFVALVPLAIGIAFLLYYFLEGRKSEALMFEHDLAQRPNGRQTPSV